MPGPKPSVNRSEIEKLINKGHLKKDIATMLGVSYDTIKKHSKGLKTIIPNTRYECRTCGIKGEDHFYRLASYQCKNCWNKRTYKSATDKMTEYMNSRGGAKCQRCGYDRYTGALEFHHRNPTEKDPSWNRGWKIDKLKIELDKCDILCANCHREVHAEMRKGNEIQ